MNTGQDRTGQYNFIQLENGDILLKYQGLTSILNNNILLDKQFIFDENDNTVVLHIIIKKHIITN